MYAMMEYQTYEDACRAALYHASRGPIVVVKRGDKYVMLPKLDIESDEVILAQTRWKPKYQNQT